jgi:Coenzyme PQQ synthesis protein D (PqqD)
MSEETDRHVEAEGDADITPDDITADFVPALVAASAMLVVDDEAVILDETTGATHLLNRTGSLVVQCFDALSSIGEIAVDLAEVFSADLDVVTADMLVLCRELGLVGMLAGVSAHSHDHSERSSDSLPDGAILHDLAANLRDGTAIDDEWLRAERTLIVSWSARCGFCSRIVPELADLEAPLMAAGVRLMLLTTSDAAEVDEQLDQVGSSLPVAYSAEIPEFFLGHGTPVAYLVEAGAVAEPLAIGAVLVPELARRLAGVAAQPPA